MVMKVGCPLLLLMILFVSSMCMAAETLEGMAIEEIRNYQQIQKMQDDWTLEERRQFEEINSLETSLKGLNFQIQKLDRQIAAEDKRIAMNKRKLVETERIRNGLQLWLLETYQSLKDSYAAGLPFLDEERKSRLDDLELVLNDPHTPVYEQFRRMFETLLVEAEYGYSSEVYRSEIELSGEKTQVDLLRVGRLALFYRSLDGRSVGLFSPASGDYTPLSEAAVEDITHAFKVVRRETAAEMVALPVGRISL